MYYKHENEWSHQFVICQLRMEVIAKETKSNVLTIMIPVYFLCFYSDSDFSFSR